MAQHIEIMAKNCTTKEAARLLDVTPRTIQLWSKAAILKAWKAPGDHRRFTVMDIEAFQTQLTTEAEDFTESIPLFEKPIAFSEIKQLVKQQCEAKSSR